MKKEEFLQQLRAALERTHVPQHEIAESIDYYREAIDDHIEEGMSEDEAVAGLGAMDQIVAQVGEAIPPVPRVLSKLTTGNRVLDVVLVLITVPIWMPAVLAIATAIVSLYVMLWSLVASLWLLVLAGFSFGLFGVAMFIAGCLHGAALTGAYVWGEGLLVVGMTFLVVAPAIWASRSLIRLTVLFGYWVAHFFIRNLRVPDIKRPEAVSWPRPLLKLSSLCVVAGFVLALMVLATCGFDASTLPALPRFWFFGHYVQPFVSNFTVGIS